MNISADKTKKILEFGPVNKDVGSWLLLLSAVLVVMFAGLSAAVGYTYFKISQFKEKIESGIKVELSDSKVAVGSNIKGVEERIDSLERIIEPISVLDPKYAVDQSVMKLNSEIWHINEERFNGVEAKVAAMTEELNKTREKIETSNKRELLYISLITLLQRVNSTFPYQAELEAAAVVADKDDVLMQNLSYLKPNATTGISSVSELQDEFTKMAGKIIKPAVPDTDKNVYEKILYNISTSFTLRKTGMVDGSTREAIVARTEEYLKRGNLALAIDEIEKLEIANPDFSSWMERANAVKQSEMAFVNIMRYLNDNSLERLSQKEQISKDNSVSTKDING